MEHFGRKIADLRAELGLSQAELARRAGIGRAKVMRMESLEEPNEVTLGNLKAVSSALCAKLEESILGL